MVLQMSYVAATTFFRSLKKSTPYDHSKCDVQRKEHVERERERYPSAANASLLLS